MPFDASRLSFPPPNKTPEKLNLDIRISPIHGRPVIHFRYIARSDFHLSSRFAKATMIRRTERDFESDRLTLIGDIKGGTEMGMKPTHKQVEGHRQAEAQILQKADTMTKVTYLNGNHEEGLEYFLNVPRKVFDVEFRQYSEYTDSKGRRLLEEHGHRHDSQLYKSAEEQSRAYRRGTAALYAASEIDLFMHDVLGMEDKSLVRWGKRRYKEYANEKQGLLRIIGESIDQSSYDGCINGHSHILDFNWSPAGKIMANAGSSTTMGSEMVVDDGRNLAGIERLRDHMNVTMENGYRYTVHFKDIGLGHFCDDPSIMDNIYTHRADQLESFAYALWPAKDQQEIRRQLDERRRAADRFLSILSEGEPLPNYGEAQRMLLMAASEAEDLKRQRGVNPYPPIRQVDLKILRRPNPTFEGFYA